MSNGDEAMPLASENSFSDAQLKQIDSLLKSNFSDQVAITKQLIEDRVLQTESKLAIAESRLDITTADQANINVDVSQRLFALEKLTADHEEDIVVLDSRVAKTEQATTLLEDHTRKHNLRFTRLNLPGRTFEICKDFITSLLTKAINYTPESIDRAHPLGNNLADVTMIVFFIKSQERQTILTKAKQYNQYCENITKTFSKVIGDVSAATLFNRRLLVEYGKFKGHNDFYLRSNRLLHEQTAYEVFNGDVFDINTGENMTLGDTSFYKPPARQRRTYSYAKKSKRPYQNTTGKNAYQGNRGKNRRGGGGQGRASANQSPIVSPLGHSTPSNVSRRNPPASGSSMISSSQPLHINTSSQQLGAYGGYSNNLTNTLVINREMQLLQQQQHILQQQLNQLSLGSPSIEYTQPNLVSHFQHFNQPQQPY